jgi:hypothetical protein
MAHYTPNEIVDIILILEECQHNYMEAAWLYYERFPDRRHLSNVVIRNCKLHARREYLHRHQRKQLSQDSTVGAMAMNPNINTRQIENYYRYRDLVHLVQNTKTISLSPLPYFFASNII